MAGPIRVRWDGGEQTFPAGSTVRFGREPGSEVLVANDNVSRRHAELVDQGGQWLLRDLGSAQGTWVGGQRTTAVPLNGPISVSLGQSPRGAVVHLTPVDQPAGSPPPGTVLPGGGLPGTVVPGHAPPPPAGGVAPPLPSPPLGEGSIIVGGSPDRPGGRLRDGAVAGATVVTGDVVNVECGGSSYSFEPGRTVSLGRDSSCDVVTANPTVSRRHATLRHDGTGWLLEDAGSASGTFVDGKRVTNQRLSGSTAAWLGTEDSGERVVLVTSGPTRKSKERKGSSRRGWLVGAGIFIVLLLVGGVALAATSSSSDASDDELAQATVKIVATATFEVDGGTCTSTSTGSGSVVDVEQGLILTNAHVVAPSAEGQRRQRLEACKNAVRPDPQRIEIFLTESTSAPAEPTYVATVENADGHVDLAVLRVESTVGGRILKTGEFADLRGVEIGDSDDVKTGDDVTVLGFPESAQSDSVSLTRGVIQGVVGDPDLDTNRAWFNVDARISPGNSGGMAADRSGRLIGVPTIVRDGEVGSVRPINLALPLIDAALTDSDYTSPYAGS